MYSHYAIGKLIISELENRNLSVPDFMKQLGYKNLNRGMRHFHTVLESPFRKEMFLEKVLVGLNFDKETLQAALEETSEQLRIEQQREEERAIASAKKYFRPFIEVCIKLAVSGMVARMAYSSYSYSAVPLPRHIPDLQLDEQLLEVGRLVREHFVALNGCHQFFGQIRGYVYHRTFDECYSFDSNGNGTLIEKNDTFQDSTFSLYIKKKDVTNLFRRLLTVKERQKNSKRPANNRKG